MGAQSLASNADSFYQGTKVGQIRAKRIERAHAAESYTVVDHNDERIPEAEAFLLHLTTLDRRPKTVRYYAYTLQLFFEWLAFRRLAVFEVSLEELAAFLPWMRTRPTRSRGSVPRSDLAVKAEGTVQMRLNQVRAFYRFYAVRDPSSLSLALLGGLSHQQGHQTPFQKRAQYSGWVGGRSSRPKTLSDEQVRVLLDACANRRDRFLFHLLDQSGLRIGEALGLHHEDLDLRRKLVRVEPRTDNDNGAWAKGLKARQVPVPDSVFDSYASYLVHEYREIDSKYVFVSVHRDHRGIPQSFASVNRVVRLLRQRTEIDFSPRMTRHTYATRLLRAGVALEVVADLLGHTDINDTRRTYIHLEAEDHRRTLITAGVMPSSRGGASS